MKKILQLIAGVCFAATINGQTYLTENFDGTWSGSPAAPSGWTQTRIVIIGDGTPEITTASTDGEKDWEQNLNTGTATWSITPGFGTFPNAAVSGSNVLFMNDSYFGSTANAFGSRRMESPAVNLLSSTNPFVRFYFFCGYASSTVNFRVMASNDGGVTWAPIMFVAPNVQSTTFSSASPFQRINIKIPNAFKVANAKFALEMSNTWGTQNLWIDDFSVEEYTPNTITSLTSGAWSNTATWVGGVVPTCDDNVIIAATHTVTMGDNITRCQNIDISGVLQYTSTSTTALFQVYGNMNVNSGGIYFSGNGTTGKRTYFGGSVANSGTINFLPGTTTGGTWVWAGYTGNYSGSGVFTNGKVPVVVHAAAGGVSYSNPFTISNTCVLAIGSVNATNLTLGNLPAAGTFLTERWFGSFTNAPTFNNTNVNQRNLTFSNPVTGSGGITLAAPQVVLNPGDEVEIISGNRQLTGVLTMNTHNNIQLNYPLSVGTFTGTQNITLTRGIIISSVANPLIIMQSGAGVTGAVPSTIVTNGTVGGGTHGSYVNGPVKIYFPGTGTATRNFPLGSGTAFHTNLPSSNVLRNLVLATSGTAWNSQTITATIENAPSGAVNAPVTTVMGSRAYRLNMNGGPALPVTASLTPRFTNSTFGGSDNLYGNLQDIRVVQSANLTGPWTERSLTNGAGVIVNNTNYTRITTSVTPGPINNGDEYFAWGSTGNAVDMAAVALVSPGTAGCYGPNQTVAVQVTNSGIAPIDFSVNNATVSADVSGAVTLTFTPVTITSGTLGIGASQTVIVTSTFNMSTVGTYSFNANINTANDVAVTNNSMTVATRTVVAALPIPYVQDFNASTALPAGVVASGNSPYLVIANHGANYNNNAASRNLFGTTTTNAIITFPKVGPVTANTYLSYDYRIQDWSGYPSSGATSLANWANDSLNVYVSTDCGVTFTLVQSRNASNHTPSIAMSNQTVNLSAFAGNDVVVRISAKKDPSGTGDYYADLDNINIYTLFPDDVGATELATPSLVGCYSAAEPVNITIKNYGINAQTTVPVTVTVAGPVNQTLTGTYVGNIASTQTVNFNIGTVNMTAAGVYSFTAITGLTIDNQPSNDAMVMATRTVVAALPLPFFDDFNAVTGNTVPAGYSADNNSSFDFLVTNNIAEHGTGNPIATRGFAVNLYSGNATSWMNLPKVGQIGSQTTFAFDYRIVDYSGYANPGGNATTLGAGDSIRLMISIDCGLTYSTIATIKATNHVSTNTFVTKTFSVGSYAGNDAIFRFDGTWSSGDYYFDLDNINICFGPPAGPVASGTTICTGSSTTLNAVTTGTAQWYATSTPTSYIATGSSYTTPILTSNTTYYVLDSTSCGLSTLTAVNVTVNPLPNVVISASSSSVCAGNNATLTATGANTYSWSTTSTSSVVVVTPTTPTTYSVTGSAVGCPDSFTTATIGIFPSPNVNISASSASVCPNSSVSLTASGASTYTWNTTATTAVIIPSPSVATVYSVTATSSLGCVGTQTVAVGMNPTPTVNLSANNNTICVGNSAIISASGASTYTWNTTATTSSISVSPTVTTMYTANGTNSLGCVGTKTINITVNPLPTVSLTAVSNTACLNGGTVGLTGSPAGGVYSGPNVVGNALNPTATGTFTPVYSFTNSTTGCTNTASTSIVVLICTDIVSQSAKSVALKVYPNPNFGSFTIETGNDLVKTIELTDVTGRVVLKQTTTSDVIRMNITDLSNGVYNVRINSSNGIDVIKVVKQ